MKLFHKTLIAGGLACAVLNAGDSRAILYIDFVAPTNAAPVTITLSGTFNRANAGTAQVATYNNTLAGFLAGINSTDVLRFSALTAGSNTAVNGQRFAFVNPRIENPFTGTFSNTIASAVIDSNFNNNTGPYFNFAFGTSGSAGASAGTFWLSNNYSNNATINRSLTFNALSLADIGFLRGSSPITYTLGTGLNSEQIVLRVSDVPGPMPILGAATAFGFSRSLRKRIRAKSRFQQSQQA